MDETEGQVVSDPVAHYVAGALAGSANIVTGYPFDTVKVRLQAHACPYSGPWQCFVNILRHEGVRGLYRGISSPLVGGAVETGINYSIFQAVLSQLDFLPEHFAVPVSAATAGFFLSFVVSPVELIKCRMQLGAADKTHSYTGAWDCTKQVLRSEGPKGLLRGLYGTMCREMPGNAVYFETYKTFRDLMGNASTLNKVEDPPPSAWQPLKDAASAITAGAVAGMVMWTVVLPIDVAKTRIQTAWPGSKHDVGMSRNLVALYREGGYRRLYAGLVPTLIRAAPANAAQWLTWEITMQQWHKWKGNSS